ncbi:Response regulator [Gammaproteobacteria bacterium]
MCSEDENIRVLVVDDEVFVAEGLRAYLEDEGIQAKVVNSAEAAVEAVRQGNTFRVCIMDMRLGDMDGNTAIRTLAQFVPSLHFLIHTGSAGYVIPEDLRTLGLSTADLFSKPQVDMGPITAAVRRLACS